MRADTWSGTGVRAVVVVLLVLGTGAAVIWGLRAGAAPDRARASSEVIGASRESPGAVTVSLTPSRQVDGQLLVDIRVTTHTVNDLDKHDLTKMISLEIDGRSIPPTSAPKLRGHHSAGQLVFPVATVPRSFTIEIRGLDQPETRVLSWP